MSTASKSLLAFAVVGALAGIVAFFNVSPFRTVVEQLAGSSVGSSFTTAKIASVNITPLTAGATSTSILNTDASARWAYGYTIADCTGLSSSYTYPNTNATALANLLLQVATTSIANLGLQGNTNYFANLVVSTSTYAGQFSNSSTTTAPVMAGYWPSGTYLTFTFNATNTAACTVAAYYLAS